MGATDQSLIKNATTTETLPVSDVIGSAGSSVQVAADKAVDNLKAQVHDFNEEWSQLELPIKVSLVLSLVLVMTWIAFYIINCVRTNCRRRQNISNILGLSLA